MKSIALLVLSWMPGACLAAEWTFWAPRQEAAPEHSLSASGELELKTTAGEHWIGCWQREYPVEGGKHYNFAAQCVASGLTTPRRSVVVRLLWQDEQGREVRWDAPTKAGYDVGVMPRAEPEYPAFAETATAGSYTFSGSFITPQSARKAVVELYLQWAADAVATYSQISLSPVPAPAPRLVRLAAAHLQPREGTEPAQKREQFAGLIAEAEKQRVDLLVLPETLTYYGTKKTLVDCAEPVPGPSTNYFGALAKKHRLHLVAGLVEREGKAVYNVAVLMDPTGAVTGKYRKVCHPRSEITAGITPGHEYPVFQTRFGKVGMMVCYDGFFPEVARALSNSGAEVIAWPVWGCNPSSPQPARVRTTSTSSAPPTQIPPRHG